MPPLLPVVVPVLAQGVTERQPQRRRVTLQRRLDADGAVTWLHPARPPGIATPQAQQHDLDTPIRTESALDDVVIGELPQDMAEAADQLQPVASDDQPPVAQDHREEDEYASDDHQ